MLGLVTREDLAKYVSVFSPSPSAFLSSAFFSPPHRSLYLSNLADPRFVRRFIDRRFPSSSSTANAAETSKLSSGGAAPPVAQAVRV